MKNQGQYVLAAAAGMIFFVAIGVMIGYNMKSEQIKHPQEEVNTYTRTILREFKPGDTLSAKENGAYILWEEWMGEELIVGVVTDSGTINTK